MYTWWRKRARAGLLVILLGTATILLHARAQSSIAVWMSPDVPLSLQPALDRLASDGVIHWVTEEQAQVKLLPSTARGTTNPLWVYAPVVPFATIADQVSYLDIIRYWFGDQSALAFLSKDGVTSPTLVTSQQTFQWLQLLLGKPAANVTIHVVPADSVAVELWAQQPAWGLMPFEQLTSTLKVLRLDGTNVLDKAVNLSAYPFVETFAFTGDETLINTVQQAVMATGLWSSGNRHPENLTTVVMTGVTALTRATAYQMELDGITLPARDILPFLQGADYIHTSNEVSFTPACGYPSPSFEVTGLRFCSSDRYFALLQAMGLNIVELTGNHVKDYGAEPMTFSLDLYDANHMQYFGGGRNLADAQKALLIRHHGNLLAFIGCNPVGPVGAWATDTTPGAAPCNDDWMASEIKRLRAIGAIVIVTLQYHEYYSYAPPADQIEAFQKYANWGANLVMGSQAHQPQAFGLSGLTFIHYGLGNLYFDQMDNLATRQMFADKLYFYQGRLLSVELFTGLIEDYMRPRPMTVEERAAFLATIFAASGW